MKDGFAALIERQFNIATPWKQDSLMEDYTGTGEKKQDIYRPKTDETTFQNG